MKRGISEVWHGPFTREQERTVRQIVAAALAEERCQRSEFLLEAAKVSPAEKFGWLRR